MLSTRRIRSLAILGLLASCVALAVGIACLWQNEGRHWSGIPIFYTGLAGPRIYSAPQSYRALRDLQPQTRLLSFDGRPLEGLTSLDSYLAKRPLGTTVRYAFERPGGERFTVDLPVLRFDTQAIFEIYLPTTLIGILLLSAGLVPVFAQPQQASARVLAALVLALVGNYLFLLPNYFLGLEILGRRMVPWPLIFGFPAVAGLLHFGLLFPKRREPLRSWPRTTLAMIYGTSAIFWITYTVAHESGHPLLLPLEHIHVGFFFSGGLILTTNLVIASTFENEPLPKQQARWLLPGIVSLFLAGILVAFSTWAGFPYYLPPLVYHLPVLLLILGLAGAILMGELFSLDSFARQLIGKGTIVLTVFSTFTLLLAIALLLAPAVPAWLITSFSMLLLASALPLITPLYRRIEDAIEFILFPSQRKMRQTLESTARDLGRLRDSAELAAYLHQEIQPSSEGDRLHLLQREDDGTLREVAPLRPAKRILLAPASALYVALHRHVNPGFIANLVEGVSSAEQREATAIGVEAAAPLHGRSGTIGALVLSGQTGRPSLFHEEFARLQALCGPTAIALENARAFDEVNALRHRLEGENLYLRTEVEQEFESGEMIGKSSVIRTALAQLHKVAKTDASVLVIGETGTGKELAVRTLHAASNRADRVLVKLACAALPEPLLESELFGHTRGAFTGADHAREGRIEIADGGTLFFDDVDTLPMGVQAKLLRVIQEGEIQRLGSNEVRRVDVRIVAATNRDLEEEVRAGRFREDLYYRLAVVPVRLPPLRERPDDIPLLVEHLVRTEGKRLGSPVDQVGAQTMAELQAYAWPGNIRELKNVIERALVLASEPRLRLPEPLLASDPQAPGVSPLSSTTLAAQEIGSTSLPELLRAYKRALVGLALQRCDGNQTRAAELLGLHRPSLSRMIRDLGLRS